MGPEFIGRVIRTSAWLAPIGALYAAVYYDLGFGAAIVVGAAWACANLYLIKLLVQTTVRSGRRSKRDAAVLGFVKFPVLYGVGFLALRADSLPLLGLLTGFWIPKGVIVLKYLGMALNRRLGAPARPPLGGDGAGTNDGAGALRGGGGVGTRRSSALKGLRRSGVSACFVFLAVSLWILPQVAAAPGAQTGESVAVEVQEQGAHESSSGHDSEEAAAGHEESASTEEQAVAGEHGEEHGEEGGHTELPNFVGILARVLPSDNPVAKFLHQWENLIFSLLSIIILAVIVWAASRRARMVPSGLQNVIEFLVEKLDLFITGILGPQGRRYVPFLGTLFIYILFMNLFGLVPFMKSPTANLNQTLALALCVFLYVQYTGIRNFGIGGYVFHMAGEPRDPISIALVPIMLPLHIIGELAKPLSLSLRLFGNITGEDVLIVIFVTLGIGLIGFLHLPIGIPLQVPFIFLAILTSTIQALVFMLLSTVYFLMMMPHEEH